MYIFHPLATNLGIPLASEKTEWPTTKLSFLDILVDSENELCTLPRDKIDAMVGLIQHTCDRKSLTVRPLLHLNHYLALQQLSRASGLSE